MYTIFPSKMGFSGDFSKISGDTQCPPSPSPPPSVGGMGGMVWKPIGVSFLCSTTELLLGKKFPITRGEYNER